MKHVLPKLPYSYKALEPYIDAKTMEIHHDLHHGGYVKKLNLALEKHPELQKKPVEELLSDIDSIPDEIKTAVINNGGGHANHSLFWQTLTPNIQDPMGPISNAIDDSFGSFVDFKKKFTEAATNHFGSGWTWLVVHEDTVEIITTPNQDSPLMDGKNPVLGLDVWEHAYYLKYQNKRADYIEAFWKLVNWKEVSELYDRAIGRAH